MRISFGRVSPGKYFGPVNLTSALTSNSLPFMPGRLTGSCTWENYCGYIRIVDRIRGIMQDLIPEIVIRLIDAYSFLWIVRQGLFNNLKMKPEETAAIEQAAAAYMEKKAQDRSQP